MNQRPPDFLELFDLDEVQRIQDAFSNATGVASLITAPDGRPLTKPSNFCCLCEQIIRKTEIGLCNCMRSDAILGQFNAQGPTMQRCLSGGLWDAGASIKLGDVHIANWLIGQVLTGDDQIENLIQYGHQIGADEAEVRAAIPKLTRMPLEQFKHVADFLFLNANLLSRLAQQNFEKGVQLEAEQRIQQEVRRERQFLQTVLDHLPCKVFWKDLNLVYQGCNRPFATAVGLDSPEQIVGQSDHQLPWRKEQTEWIRFSDRQVIQTNEPILNFEEHLREADGRDIVALTNKVPLRNEQGTVIGVLSIYLDITEKVHIAEALRESEERFRSVVQRSPMGVHLWEMNADNELILVETNLRSDTFTGISTHDLIGKSMEQAFPGLVDTEFLARCRRTALHDDSWQMQNFPYRDGRFSGVYDVFVFQTSLRRLAIMFLEVSERVRAEEERRQFEGQLRHAQKLESLGVLAGGIAHDFNNLLTGIMGNADLGLFKLPDDSPARINFETVLNISQCAADLCHQMLAYSGKGKFVVEPLDLASLVRDMRQMLDISVSKKVMLHCLFDAALPSVIGDATQIRQVIMNLIMNASDALGDRGGEVTVLGGVAELDPQQILEMKLPEELSPGRYVFLEVRDQGIGMDAKTQERIFDPFFTTKFAGRGLGLAAVQGIVRGHNGAIHVSSVVGQGSTFRIYLPASDDVQPKTKRDPNHITEWHGSGTWLVVDDNPDIRELARQTLQQAGFDVMLAEDGLQGLELYHHHRADLHCILLDLTMPRMDGRELLLALHKLGNAVPILLMSGYGEHEIVRSMEGQGLAGFIQKPFTHRSLLQQCKACLEKIHSNPGNATH